MAEKLPPGPSTSDASVTNWDLAGKARSKCVTNVGHKVQLPPGPSTRLCLETIRYERGHNVQPPLGPSTGRLSEKLGFGGMAHSTLGSPFGGAGTALAVTERALSAPFGGTSPIGRGKR